MCASLAGSDALCVLSARHAGVLDRTMPNAACDPRVAQCVNAAGAMLLLLQPFSSSTAKRSACMHAISSALMLSAGDASIVLILCSRASCLHHHHHHAHARPWPRAHARSLLSFGARHGAKQCSRQAWRRYAMYLCKPNESALCQWPPAPSSTCHACTRACRPSTVFVIKARP